MRLGTMVNSAERISCALAYRINSCNVEFAGEASGRTDGKLCSAEHYLDSSSFAQWSKIDTYMPTGTLCQWVCCFGFIQSSLPYGGYLVDPASSHMLVSKIKPCMSKYKLLIL